LYGSDFPYALAALVGDLCDIMDRELEKLFCCMQRNNINSGNAKKLFGSSGAEKAEEGPGAKKEKYPPALVRQLKDCLCL
jgi:hypothetical protein